MNKEKLRLIVRNLELLTQALKDELNVNDIKDYSKEEISYQLNDYDEVFYEEED